MTATMTSPNGRMRKSLAGQIDRLDEILDGLAEAINDTVLEAVRQAVNQTVKVTVQTAIQEMLNHPSLQLLIAVRKRANFAA